MANPSESHELYKSHPYPEKCGIQSLFRFYKINWGRIEYLKHLFLEQKLYHSLPSNFNDPFECRPYFFLPQEATGFDDIRQHLIKISRENGVPEEEAEETVSELMRDQDQLQRIITNATHYACGQVRICSFTSQKDNLLLWSHYADAHRGFCVEFDATKAPISQAYRVKYGNKYPEVKYPSSDSLANLIPLLIKSEDWQYENEFRTFLVPWAKNPPANDGESLLLNIDTTKNIYLGSKLSVHEERLIVNLVQHGPFSPGIWRASLANSTFSLDFKQVG